MLLKLYHLYIHTFIKLFCTLHINLASTHYSFTSTPAANKSKLWQAMANYAQFARICYIAPSPSPFLQIRTHILQWVTVECSLVPKPSSSPSNIWEAEKKRERKAWELVELSNA